jgi:secreted PhoX family phosphatase
VEGSIPLIDRRRFLTHSARLMGGGWSAFAALQALGCERREPRDPTVGYGPLEDAGPELALPSGFQYRILGVQGSAMSDGQPTPPLHDGMAAFALPNGKVRLIRNHEVGSAAAAGATLGDPARAYDPLAGGGTTSLEIDPATRELTRDFVSLSGTLRNCAGGPTPWQSWITCEESFADQRQGYQRRHGYVFDVPVSAERDVPAEPLPALGRFVHEAVAVDPVTGIVYETEDQRQAGFYRFVPDGTYQPGQRPNLSRGRLQMLAVRDRPRYDTGSAQVAGAALPVTWVDIPDSDPAGTSVEVDAVFRQGWDQGAARFARIEGCWHERGAIYFSCTSGGDAELGQIWRHRPGLDGGDLTLVFESLHRDILKNPDNICSTPKGAIVLCEDASGSCLIRGLTPEGEIFDFARNIANGSEFAGATFSPDGQTLFVNIQGSGQTVAIWGPWERGPF